MNDEGLDTWLRAADPARETPESLSAMVDELVATVDEELPKLRWRPVVVAGGALALVGALAAGTDLASYVMTIPPFAGLDWGSDFRTFEGLPYVPWEGPHQGDQCVMYIELGGLTDAQEEVVSEFWPAIDSGEFDNAVRERMDGPSASPGTDAEIIEDSARRAEVLARLESVVPGVQWGGRPPGEFFEEGDPHLVSTITSCVADLDDSGAAE